MTANRGWDGVDFVAVRRAGVLLGGKAPTTVKSLVIEGQLEAKTVHTEAGHKRLVISTASIRHLLDRWEAERRAAEAAKQAA
jgi:hypothetical protein